MGFSEKLLYCVDCNKSFSFSAEEQEFHASRGFINEPGRCPSCRQAKRTQAPKNEDGVRDFSLQRKTVAVTCSQCGKATRVPFNPRENKAVYCSDCYSRSRSTR
jgi:CxxC-x17-CxxC domain-containing protein